MIGFGTAFVQLASPLLITETAYPSQRPALSSLYNTMWFSGAIIAAWATFGTFRIASTWSWRIPSVLQAAPSAFQLLFVWFIPESPRFLVRKGRDDEALRILTKYHANGDREDPLIEVQLLPSNSRASVMFGLNVSLVPSSNTIRSRKTSPLKSR